MATSIDVASPPGEAVSRAVRTFQKQVSGQWTRKRVPNGLRAALDSRTQAQTAKIFRRAGMLAFLAYHLAHTRRSGKSTLLKFVQLSEATRKEVAERVAALNVHSSVRDCVDKLEVDYPTESRPSTTANQPEDQDDSCPPPPQDMNLTTTETSQRDESTLGSDVDQILATLDASHTGIQPSLSLPQQRSAALDVSQHDAPILSSQDKSDETRDMINTYRDSFPSSLHQSGPTASDSSQHRVSLFPTPQQRLSLAFPQKIPGLFPEYMAGAIIRDYIQTGEDCICRAAVEVMFPQDGRLDCIMSLDVKNNKVEYIARTLFDVQVEAGSGERRQILLPRGVRLMLNSEITLSGAQYEAVRELFGPEIYAGIIDSSIYHSEKQEGASATGCVTMVIPWRTSGRATINVVLGVRVGYRAAIDLGLLIPF